MLSCSVWFSAPGFWVDGGLESRCVGRVFGADGAVRLARHHPPAGFEPVNLGTKGQHATPRPSKPYEKYIRTVIQGYSK